MRLLPIRLQMNHAAVTRRNKEAFPSATRPAPAALRSTASRASTRGGRCTHRLTPSGPHQVRTAPRPADHILALGLRTSEWRALIWIHRRTLPGRFRPAPDQEDALECDLLDQQQRMGSTELMGANYFQTPPTFQYSSAGPCRPPGPAVTARFLSSSICSGV